jgi:hypothetical protein
LICRAPVVSKCVSDRCPETQEPVTGAENLNLPVRAVI